jgi:hypothetical protein
MGTALDDKCDPWLLTNLVRTNFKRLQANAPPLTRLESLLAVFLAWGLVPITLFALWGRYLPAHDWLGTSCLVFPFSLATLFGRHTYRLGRDAHQGAAPAGIRHHDDDRRILARAWHELFWLRSDRLTLGLIAGLTACSFIAFRDNPRDPYTWGVKALNSSAFEPTPICARLR